MVFEITCKPGVLLCRQEVTDPLLWWESSPHSFDQIARSGVLLDSKALGVLQVLQQTVARCDRMRQSRNISGRASTYFRMKQEQSD